jgi:hypothetical protein
MAQAKVPGRAAQINDSLRGRKLAQTKLGLQFLRNLHLVRCSAHYHSEWAMAASIESRQAKRIGPDLIRMVSEKRPELHSRDSAALGPSGSRQSRPPLESKFGTLDFSLETSYFRLHFGEVCFTSRFESRHSFAKVRDMALQFLNAGGRGQTQFPNIISQFIQPFQGGGELLESRENSCGDISLP